MKKLIFSITLIATIVSFSFTSSFAQTTDSDSLATAIGDMMGKIFSTKVYMLIDSTVFPTKEGNFYFNETEKAMIMTMVVPQSFDKAEEHFDKESKKDGYKVVEKKKFTHDGRNFLYQKGTIKKDGNKGVMYLYAIQGTAESSIFFTAVHAAGRDAKFFPAIERAALSARLQK